MKYILKEKAIALRREGLTYTEILKQIPVAKSTLTEWFHSAGLAKYEIQRLTEAKVAAAKRGGEAKRKQRIDNTKVIFDKAILEIGSLSKREIWLIGIMLYWAEGAKQKPHNISAQVKFTNMDPLMIYIFLHWLKKVCNVREEDIIFEICVHETHRHRVNKIIDFWSEKIGIPRKCFTRIYFKKANIKTNRKNVGERYFGVMTCKVRSSTSFNRKIAGWTQGVVESFC